jgi:hypothetical protein
MNNFILTIFVFPTILSALYLPKSSCPAGGAIQSTINSSICYLYFSIDLTTFDKAENFCNTWYNGHIVSVTNAYVNAFIFGKILSSISFNLADFGRMRSISDDFDRFRSVGRFNLLIKF